MTPLQYIGIIFAIFALSRAFLRWKDKSISRGELFFWTLVWSSVVTVALFPGIFTWLSRMLGIGRGVDILLYGGMIVIFYLMFRLYVKIESQQRDITKLVRKLALVEKGKTITKEVGNTEKRK
jgi:small membrane protein